VTEGSGARFGLTDAICDLVEEVSASTISAEALQRGRASLIDTVAVILAGSSQAASRQLRDALALHSRSGTATVIGTPHRAPILEAALANGYSAHALDYDDTIQGFTTHPSCHLLPALLAVAEAGSTGDLLVAHLLGIEVEYLLARVMNPEHGRRGWHTTGTIGALAAAVAVGKAMSLTRSQLRTALAIAASSASGLRANFGTMIKPLHAGKAARSGVEAAILAANGFDGVADPMEHRFGVLAVYGAAVDISSGLPSELKPDPSCSSALRVTLKPYPCCGEATALAEAALRLQTMVVEDEIASIELLVTPFAREILEFDHPRTPDEARFSGPYCVAAALHVGRLGVGEFEPPLLQDSTLLSLLQRARVTISDSLGDHGGGVVVTTSAGRRYEERVQVPKGHASVGLSEDDLATKFLQCATPVLGHERSSEVLRGLMHSNHELAVSDWLQMLSPQGVAGEWMWVMGR
jgi:2-methylcitrate dehydratase PrpD